MFLNRSLNTQARSYELSVTLRAMELDLEAALNNKSEFIRILGEIYPKASAEAAM